MTARTARQQGRRGNNAGATRGRRGTVVDEAAGPGWQRGQRGSRAGVATLLARLVDGEALWLVRQRGRRGNTDREAGGQGWQHCQRNLWMARHCGR
jgi:hypothetical protein